ncbi:hypothetical protein GF377_07725, partial [candidate division GN15 bacterium]|nr:hypothetical protein [candidate division GN15 bacterium]
MLIRPISLCALLALPLVCSLRSPVSAFERPWQQEVNYIIDVTLADDGRTISGTIDIEYINQSPDTLDVIYLKAYPNACQPGSYSDKWLRGRGIDRLSDLTEEQQGSLTIERPAGMDEFDLPYRYIETDNSIIAVHLNQPLPPLTTIELPFDFVTVLPKPAQLRMGVSSAVTKAVYWYPQVCVYDHRRGWVNSQYLGNGECYGDFGTYIVSITAPDNMIVAATGYCENEPEVLPDTLRAMLQLDNFLGPRDEWPEFDFDSVATRTWQYYAENVNDFAFTASANWCLDADTVGGVEVVAYALRHKAESWQEAAEKGAGVIEFYSETFYPYPYPVMRLCDAFSGMEYPMLTNISNGAPNPFFDIVIFHEIGHQWFMAM